MFWLKLISKFIKILRAGESPSAIAGGITIGFLIGLTPFWSLQNVLLLILAILTTVNLASVFFSLFLFNFTAYLFDPWFHDLGYFILVKVDFLQTLWITLYNMPLAPFTRFYNTVVMGSTLSALVLAPIIYLLSLKGVIIYRNKWADRIQNHKIIKYLKSTTIVQWYLKLRDLRW